MDDRDSRLELRTLLCHLPPWRRIAFLQWACAQATLASSTIHPTLERSTVCLAEQATGWTLAGQPLVPQRATVRLAEMAAICDRADDALTMEIVFDICHLTMHFALDLPRVMDQLVSMARHP